jgi:signal transduction histidine kinase
MLQRMLANLIDNAIKYTPDGGHVRVAAGAQTDAVHIVVEDSGVGISASDRERVFARFFRGDQSRCQPGSGLGLSLAQTIAHAHGGRISLQSAPGKGSAFTIRLPARAL